MAVFGLPKLDFGSVQKTGNLLYVEPFTEYAEKVDYDRIICLRVIAAANRVEKNAFENKLIKLIEQIGYLNVLARRR